jgi:hypothetical protein
MIALLDSAIENPTLQHKNYVPRNFYVKYAEIIGVTFNYYIIH